MHLPNRLRTTTHRERGRERRGDREVDTERERERDGASNSILLSLRQCLEPVREIQ